MENINPEVNLQGQGINQQMNKNLLPNNTLYINNLNEKIKSDELKQTLFQLFSQYGDILEIHSRKSFKMKGQAFIVFRDLQSATNAKHALDGAMIFGKNIRVNYSKSSSDTILKLSGQYTHKDKVKIEQDRRKRRDEEYQEIRKKQKEKQLQPGVVKEKKEAPKNVISSQSQGMIQPNNVLFVENLAADLTEPLLRNVFSKYNGFKEVRLYAGKGIAFVEYDNEINAGGALLGLNNLPLTNDCVLKISFAKK